MNPSCEEELGNEKNISKIIQMPKSWIPNGGYRNMREAIIGNDLEGMHVVHKAVVLATRKLRNSM